MSEHFVEICVKCQATIAQCRCFSPNKTVRHGICSVCRSEMEAIAACPGDERKRPNARIEPCGWCRKAPEGDTGPGFKCVECCTHGCLNAGIPMTPEEWNERQEQILAARREDYEAGWHDFEQHGGNWMSPEPRFNDYIAGKAG